MSVSIVSISLVFVSICQLYKSKWYESSAPEDTYAILTNFDKVLPEYSIFGYSKCPSDEESIILAYLCCHFWRVLFFETAIANPLLKLFGFD